jgi:hypothetical protein
MELHQLGCDKIAYITLTRGKRSKQLSHLPEQTLSVHIGLKTKKTYHIMKDGLGKLEFGYAKEEPDKIVSQGNAQKKVARNRKKLFNN